MNIDKYKDSFCMDALCSEAYADIDEQYRLKPWKILSHGTELLTTELQLNAYIVAYGDMHQGKCRAAFQKFPFDKLTSAFEIIDWGAGQGIASLTLCDMLKERDCIALLKKVTLIEPSEPALKRAVTFITKAYPAATVVPVNQYLPGRGGDNEIKGINSEYKITIHLFSNILDIGSVDLIKLAHIIEGMNGVNYVMCMGPMNSGYYRIDKFCSLFGPEHFITDIAMPQYGLSRTFHQYSCKTKGFQYTGEPLTTTDYNKYRQLPLINNKEVYNDYDPRLLVENNVVSYEVANIYAHLALNAGSDDSVFFKPDINGCRPDIVIVCRNKGVAIITICEDNLETIEKDNKAGDKTDKKTTSDISVLDSLNKYRDDIIKLYNDQFLGKALSNSKYFGIIKCVCIFTACLKSDIENFLNEEVKDGQEGKTQRKKKYKYINIIDKNVRKDELWKSIGQERNKSLFDEGLYKSFMHILSPQWHSYKMGKYITLNTQQRNLSESKNTKQKINGVAGSGKTQVLAVRAVNAHLRTGKKVLVLSYNITLVNYLKYRINEVRADFAWNNICITNYHQLVKNTALSFSMNLKCGEYDNPELFKNERINRFAAIFVDEVQDYKSNWLKLLNDSFLEPDGEFVVFGDAGQNIYNRDEDNNGQIKIGVIGGLWNNSLNKGYRFRNALLQNLAEDFQQMFYEKTDTGFAATEAATLFNGLKYFAFEHEVEWTKLEYFIANDIIKKYGLDIADTVILSQSYDVLRSLDQAYRQRTGLQTLTTCETEEEFKTLIAKGENKGYYDIKKIRRNKKLHFTMEAECLKMSSIHSFKGWEARTVILILSGKGETDMNTILDSWENDNKRSERADSNTMATMEDRLIYTAITRATENLYIINLNQKRYHDFFKEKIAPNLSYSNAAG